MIKFQKGDILRSQTDALVNTVNTQGIMGKGIALAFKNAFPLNYKLYEKACFERQIDIGKLFVTETGELYPRLIINFPTKKHWRYPSKYEYIEAGLIDLIRIIEENNIQSISIPPLGSGNGKLDWSKVKQMIIQYLDQMSRDIEIIIFEPGYNNQQVAETKEVHLTPTRALFIYLLKSYQVLGYEANLLVAQKIAYFLQRFGENLNLSFEKGEYGPYAHNLNHLLKHINNSFICFDEQNNLPGTEVHILKEKLDDVINYYNTQTTMEQKSRVENVKNFIEGFESPYGLELLATVDYVITMTGKKLHEDVMLEIGKWTSRKKEIMKPEHIEIALNRLNTFKLI